MVQQEDLILCSKEAALSNSEKKRIEQEEHHSQSLLAAQSCFEQRLAIMDDAYSRKINLELLQRQELQGKIDEMTVQMNEKIHQARTSAVQELSTQLSKLKTELEDEKSRFARAEERFQASEKAWIAEKNQLSLQSIENTENTKASTTSALAEKQQASLQRARGEAAVYKQRYEEQCSIAIAAQQASAAANDEANKLRKELDCTRQDLSGARAELYEQEKLLQQKENMLVNSGKQERSLQEEKARLQVTAEDAVRRAEAADARAGALEVALDGSRKEYKAMKEKATGAELESERRKQREYAARQETKRYHAASEALRRTLHRIQNDIRAASASILDHKALKNAVIKMYQMYAETNALDGVVAVGKEGKGSAPFVQEETTAHDGGASNFQETIAQLKQQLKHAKDNAAKEKQRYLLENMNLIKEIEDLQR